MKLLPLPLDGLPPGADQLKETGEVPPVVDAVQLTGVLTDPLLGQLSVSTNGCGAMVIGKLWAEVETPFASLALTIIE